MRVTQRITSSRSPGQCRLKASRMNVAFFLVTLLTLLGGASAIKCYRCAVVVETTHIQNGTVTIPMCSKFDKSDEYIFDCPFSTMCLKTISTLHLKNGQKQETITRGCAQQKYTTQVFRNRQWQREHSVQEVYEEGCSESTENNLAASARTYCYCRGELCNTAARSGLRFEMALVIVLFKLLALVLKLC